MPTSRPFGVGQLLKYPILTVVICLIAAVAGCSRSGTEEQYHATDSAESILSVDAVALEAGEKLSVVASTSIIGDVVVNIGGDRIELHVLVGVGQDPHSYEPRPSDLAYVERADLVFINGFGLEEGLIRTIENTAGGAMVPVSLGIDPITSDFAHQEQNDGDGSHEHGSVDPHVWFDPTNVMVWVDNIEHVLSEADPVNRDYYRERSQAYRKRLVALDQSMRSRFASLPESHKKLVSDHRVFGHFADEYGFESVGAILPGATTSGETSARQTADLVETLRRENVMTLFVGSTAGRGLGKLAEALAGELGPEVKIVDILTGSLTEEGIPGNTYIDYMEYNAAQVMKGLSR